MMHTKFSVVPGGAVTLNVTSLPCPLGPKTIESPGASKPAAPTLTSGIGGGPDGGGPSGFTPCDFEIAPQTLQFSTWLAVRGSCDCLTIESECGSAVVLVNVTVPPERTGTVPGTKWKVFLM